MLIVLLRSPSDSKTVKLAVQCVIAYFFPTWSKGVRTTSSSFSSSVGGWLARSAGEIMFFNHAENWLWFGPKIYVAVSSLNAWCTQALPSSSAADWASWSLVSCSEVPSLSIEFFCTTFICWDTRPISHLKNTFDKYAWLVPITTGLLLSNRVL